MRARERVMPEDASVGGDHLFFGEPRAWRFLAEQAARARLELVVHPDALDGGEWRHLLGNLGLRDDLETIVSQVDQGLNFPHQGGKGVPLSLHGEARR